MAVTLSDFTPACDIENGGIERVVVLKWCDRNTYTIDGDTYTITALTTDIGTKAYTILNQDMANAKYDDNGQGNRDNNSTFRNHVGMIKMNDDEEATALLDYNLGRTRTIHFVKYARPLDKDTKWKVYGFLNGLAVETSEASTGQKYEDHRGHTINLTGQEITPALNISDAIVQTILVPAS